MFGTPKASIEKLTPALVTRMRNASSVRTERDIKCDRLEFLNEQIEAGTFLDATALWVLAYCKENKVTYRANGNHTSRAFADILGAGRKLPNLRVVLHTYTLGTRKLIEDLHMMFDARESARTPSELNQIVASGLAGLERVGRRVLGPVVSGLSFSILGDANKNERARERAIRIRDEVPFIRWADRFMKPTINGAGLCRGPVAAALHQTYNKNRNLATRFWTMVRDGVQTTHGPNDPVHRLFCWLPVASLGNRAVLRRVTNTNSACGRGMYVRCIQAWNCWLRCEELGKWDDGANEPLPDVLDNWAMLGVAAAGH